MDTAENFLVLLDKYLEVSSGQSICWWEKILLLFPF